MIAVRAYSVEESLYSMCIYAVFFGRSCSDELELVREECGARHVTSEDVDDDALLARVQRLRRRFDIRVGYNVVDQTSVVVCLY